MVILTLTLTMGCRWPDCASTTKHEVIELQWPSTVDAGQTFRSLPLFKTAKNVARADGIAVFERDLRTNGGTAQPQPSYFSNLAFVVSNLYHFYHLQEQIVATWTNAARSVLVNFDCFEIRLLTLFEIFSMNFSSSARKAFAPSCGTKRPGRLTFTTVSSSDLLILL